LQVLQLILSWSYSFLLRRAFALLVKLIIL
jgi:hypothetical protein